MAEIKIQELLETIKTDGINKAKEEADKIIAEAKEKAQEIVQEANAEAEKIKLECQKEQELFKKQASDSIRQACSNSLISLRQELNSMIAKLITKNLNDSLASSDLITLIKEALKERGNNNCIIELSDKVVSNARKELANEIASGLEIKINESLKSGFKLVEKDNSGYYDFSSNELIEIIKPYLSSSVKKVLES